MERAGSGGEGESVIGGHLVESADEDGDDEGAKPEPDDERAPVVPSRGSEGEGREGREEGADGGSEGRQGWRGGNGGCGESWVAGECGHELAAG